MTNLRTATEQALKQFHKALPHVEAARTILADALGVDPDERPEVDIKGSPDQRDAVRLMQNIWSAHLHVTDPFGS